MSCFGQVQKLMLKSEKSVQTISEFLSILRAYFVIIEAVSHELRAASGEKAESCRL